MESVTPSSHFRPALHSTMSSSSSERQPLHILFFPFMGAGHMNPMLHLACLFARRGVTASLVTTPANAPKLPESSDNLVHILLIPFPSSETGLPAGCENIAAVTSPEMRPSFFKALSMLRDAFAQLLDQIKPDCLVSDAFLPWTAEIAREARIPRIAFHGTSFFSHCIMDAINRHNVREALADPGAGSGFGSSESVLLPGLPHRVELLASRIPGVRDPNRTRVEFFESIRKAESKSHGMLVNSFYELEPDYANHYRKVAGMHVWHVGPVSLCNDQTASRGHGCFDWLEKQRPGSVVYVCFGSMTDMGAQQVTQLAKGFENCGHPFLWVFKDNGGDWNVIEYQERIRGKGLVVKGWAPQVAILNHAAIGGFMTHCGWNSCLEGISAGVPMITWPQFAEQFFNERLIVDVLKIGVEVMATEEEKEGKEVVGAVGVENAVVRLMGDGEEAQKMRRRVKELGEMAKRAVEEGGSSYDDVDKLIEELIRIRG